MLCSLSKVAVDAFRSRARESARVAAADLKESSAGLMEKLHLWDGTHLKRAAVLAFHPEPERFVTGALVKIGFFRSNDDLRYHDEVRGPLFMQVDQTVQLLRLKYLKAAISYEGIQRVETYPVPEHALREAVLNAIIHKDYATGVPVQISVYDDKLMVWNPGQLPPSWTVEKLKQKHSSHPYNPDLANVFFRAGDIEAWGRGIERIVAACRAAGFPEPVIEQESTGLWVTFPYSADYLRGIDGRVTREVTPEVTPEVATEVTTEVKLLRVMTTDLTRQALQAALGLKNDEHFRKSFLLPALERGLIEMTIPDRPTSRLQRYRITEAGRTLLRTTESKG